MASPLNCLLAKGVEWGSLSDDDDDDKQPQPVQIHPDPELEADFEAPKTRNSRRKEMQHKREERRRQTKIFVFSDIWIWDETPFQFQGIAKSVNEMENMFKKFKWAHAYSASEKLIWNKNKHERTLHEPDAAYMERFNKAVVE